MNQSITSLPLTYSMRPTMSAIVTTTSQTVETRILSNGNEVATNYFPTLDAALDHLDTMALDSIEIETLDI